MAEEIQALEKNETWTLEDLSPGQNPVSCKWVCRVQYNSDGAIQHYKARLVIRGDLQIKGFNYNETFAPVAKTSVRCFLAIVVANGWDLYQLEVKNVFLHGDLEENYI